MYSNAVETGCLKAEMSTSQSSGTSINSFHSDLDYQFSNVSADDSLRKKFARPNLNLAGLSVSTGKAPQDIIRLQPVSTIQEPQSANPFLRRNNLKEAVTAGYLECYENAERFIDESGLNIVEPGAETKLRKHVKVLSRFDPQTYEEEASTPVYTGSPVLQKVSDSSLLARRAFSLNNQSPFLKVIKMDDECAPVSKSQLNTPLRTLDILADSENILEKTKSLGQEQKGIQFNKLFISNERSGLPVCDITDSPLRIQKNSLELAIKKSVASGSTVSTQTSIQELK